MWIRDRILYFLCRLALRWRMSAFFFAAPEPCKPVMYVFFLAFVFTLLGSSLGFFAPDLKTMPAVMA